MANIAAINKAATYSCSEWLVYLIIHPYCTDEDELGQKPRWPSSSCNSPMLSLSARHAVSNLFMLFRIELCIMAGDAEAKRNTHDVDQGKANKV
jgi:hypothetical protein